MPVFPLHSGVCRMATLAAIALQPGKPPNFYRADLGKICRDPRRSEFLRVQ